MARSAAKPCREPGCAQLCVGLDREFNGFCATHGPREKRANSARRRSTVRTRGYSAQRRANASESEKALLSFYNSPAWQKCRKAFRAANPLCKSCEALGRVTAAEVVDHIVERRDGGSDLDWNNLQSLCHTCHNRKTAIEKRNRNETNPNS